MKGVNTMTLNQATMLEAIQLWLDHQFREAPRATAVKPADSYSETFEVTVEEPA